MAAPINRYAWKQSGLIPIAIRSRGESEDSNNNNDNNNRLNLSNAGVKEETIRKQRTNSYGACNMHVCVHGCTVILFNRVR
jgi:hypothetical protein